MQFPANFKLIVKPNMPKTVLVEYDKDKGAYKMEVAARPEKGRANMEIIKFFRKNHKLDIRIISGLTSRVKLVKTYPKL